MLHNVKNFLLILYRKCENENKNFIYNIEDEKITGFI